MQEEISIKKKAEDFRNQLSSSVDEILDFFICFSKFEYALKQAGYHQEEKNKVSPNWEAFAKDIAPLFDEQNAEQRGEMLNEAINFFRRYPPRKQVLIEDQVDFKDVPYEGGSLLEWLVGAIKRVRNNLFHGGKWPYLDLQARNSSLLNHGLVILQERLALCGSEKLTKDVSQKTWRVREAFGESIR